MIISRIGRVIAIWGKVFFKIRVSFDGLVIRKKVFSKSIHQIETHLDVFVEILEVQIIFYFVLFLDEYLIEF